MTKEEQWIKGSIENYIFAYTGKRAKISDADAQHFTASVMSYLNLCTPSLPANLDEAAEEYAIEVVPDSFVPDKGNGYKAAYTLPDIKAAFKAGAEWMAGQGATFTSVVDYYDGFFIDSSDEEQDAINKLGLKAMDKVIVQIRKK